MQETLTKKGCAIVGAGRLGCALAEALHASGYRVVAVSSQIKQEAEELCHRLATPQVCELAQVPNVSSHIFLTVPDGIISDVAEQLEVQSYHSVIHCSGATELSVLLPAVKRGAKSGCFHPLQSFPARMGCGTRFSGIHIGVEGDAELVMWLEHLCTHLGASPIRLDGCNRALYHAAAVFVSNYLTALFQAATETWTSAGLPQEEARRALAPLTQGALSAIQSTSLSKALTGPVARGDIETITKHMMALKNQPEILSVYRELGLRLLALDLDLSPHVHKVLSNLLSDDVSDVSKD